MLDLKRMKIIIASDSYKGSNTSMRVAELIEAGAKAVFPEASYVKIPIADGGEGTVEALTSGLRGKIEHVKAQDALGRPIDSFYGVLGDKAVLEMAAASGLPLLARNERNPLITSTFGTGQQLLAALNAGYKDITIGIGGSATNDGGAGMARALGYRFLNSEGRELPEGGAALAELTRLDDTEVSPLLQEAKINVACDVDNPLLGPNGASATYGPQKGANEAAVEELDAALTNFADVVERWKGSKLRNSPGTGAAGGLGFGLMAFCNARIESGINTILDLVNFESQLKGAHLVITGEGRIDGQTIRGKVPVGVAIRAKKCGIPVLAIVGDIGSNAKAVFKYGIDSIMSTVDRTMRRDEAMERSSETLQDAAQRACMMIRIGMKIAEL
ncbi:Glycerate kinase [Olavius algarvensis spirochete endosymbiont]|uniref:glycerate kinase n=1 Tax=Olavius algarvensis spirochete endosymbiont TaxID=260710 RepID=UPI000F16F522|nr:glycerate kinase [Olavius algarvensis spirochete endosymbiont]VDB00688.1 Glycerate kinase [Olavius algarvensis spirochete endosymbiont]